MARMAPHSDNLGLPSPAEVGGAAGLRGPGAPNDLRVELRGVEPVDPARRFGHPFRLFTLWFTAQISPSTFFVGVLGTASFIALGWRWGLVAIVAGNLLGSITVGLLAVLGCRTGAPQLQQSREAFGRTVHFPATLTWITQIGFEALAAIFGAEALHVLLGLNYYAGLVVTFACMAVLSVTGYEAIHLFEKVMSVVLLILFAVITAKTFLAHPHIVSHVSGGPFIGGFVLMLAIVVGYAVSWGPVASDYSRYLPERTPAWTIYLAVFGGLVLGMTWIEILGFGASALLAGLSSMAGVAHIMGGGSAGDLAMVAMFLGTIAILAVEDYSGALAAQAAGVSLLRPFVTAISAAVAFAVAAWLNTGSTGAKFEDVLLLISYWITPWTAVVLIDWVRRGRRRSWPGHLSLLGGSFAKLRAGVEEWGAVAAVVVGFIVCLPFSDTSTGASIAKAAPPLAWLFGGFANHFVNGGDLAFYVGFVVGGLVYLSILAVSRRGKSRSAVPAVPRAPAS
jgi:NCS1 family nucleobase:cation symporter-1